MDPDVCDIDVDQNLDLSVPDADTRLEDTHPAAPRRYRIPSIVEYYLDNTLDRTVSTGG